MSAWVYLFGVMTFDIPIYETVSSSPWFWLVNSYIYDKDVLSEAVMAMCSVYHCATPLATTQQAHNFIRCWYLVKSRLERQAKFNVNSMCNVSVSCPIPMSARNDTSKVLLYREMVCLKKKVKQAFLMLRDKQIYVCEKISYMMLKKWMLNSLFLFELHKMRHVTSEHCLAIYCCFREQFFLAER